MYNHILYLTYWGINALTLLAFNFLFPDNVVLGNFKFSMIEAAIYAGFWVTVVFWTLWDVAIAREFELRNKLFSFSFFLLINSFSVWIMARFPDFVGLGISRYYWAILIAIFTTTAQQFAFRRITGMGKKA